eukprot:455316-Alexandrium_andersonii.AAC.1
MGRELRDAFEIGRPGSAQVLKAHFEFGQGPRGRDVLRVQVRHQGRIEAQHRRAVLAPAEPVA